MSSRPRQSHLEVVVGHQHEERHDAVDDGHEADHVLQEEVLVVHVDPLWPVLFLIITARFRAVSRVRYVQICTGGKTPLITSHTVPRGEPHEPTQVLGGNARTAATPAASRAAGDSCHLSQSGVTERAAEAVRHRGHRR